MGKRKKLDKIIENYETMKSKLDPFLDMARESHIFSEQEISILEGKQKFLDKTLDSLRITRENHDKILVHLVKNPLEGYRIYLYGIAKSKDHEKIKRQLEDQLGCKVDRTHNALNELKNFRVYTEDVNGLMDILVYLSVCEYADIEYIEN